MRRIILLIAASIAAPAVGVAQSNVFSESPDHLAIRYAVVPTTDLVVELNAKIRAGRVRLKFGGASGYLKSVLEALNVPLESQMAVFAKTSLQARIINPRNPRTIFFNDSVAIGWVRGEPFVEVAVQDPQQGTIFYTLEQRPSDQPEFVRKNGACLSCHLAYSSLGVPGMLLRSVFPARDGTPERTLGDYNSDHRSPIDQRWGGWYVTGQTGILPHMGNKLYTDPNNADAHAFIEPTWDTDVYLSPYSDVVALMVFEHQMHMMNLLTRLGWELRVAEYEKRVFDPGTAAREIVDYMLFVDELPIGQKIQGTSGFAEKFAAAGPRDLKGRSLRDVDLERRLMRYPCSYMIYTKAFDGLPPEGREAIYKRMWRILSGQEKDAKYSVLAQSDRQAIIEILRDTKKGLPDFFLPAREEANRSLH